MQKANQKNDLSESEKWFNAWLTIETTYVIITTQIGCIQYSRKYRGVAQFGRALRSGRRSRVFESPHSDQTKKDLHCKSFFVCVCVRRTQHRYERSEYFIWQLAVNFIVRKADTKWCCLSANEVALPMKCAFGATKLPWRANGIGLIEYVDIIFFAM